MALQEAETRESAAQQNKGEMLCQHRVEGGNCYQAWVWIQPPSLLDDLGQGTF